MRIFGFDISRKKSLSVPEKKIRVKNSVYCDNCQESFVPDPDNIFKIAVPLLYSTEYIDGLGYICPNCKTELIIG
jgi:hypothetical protein